MIFVPPVNFRYKKHTCGKRRMTWQTMLTWQTYWWVTQWEGPKPKNEICRGTKAKKTKFVKGPKPKNKICRWTLTISRTKTKNEKTKNSNLITFLHLLLHYYHCLHKLHHHHQTNTEIHHLKIQKSINSKQQQTQSNTFHYTFMW